MSVTAPKGFVAAGGVCGLKRSGRPDLAIVATTDAKPVPAAGVFTQSKCAAAPVQLCRSHLHATGGHAAAVVINSGNANAATGAVGLDASRRMARVTAAGVGCKDEHVLVCSTGLIGIPFPIEKIEAGIPAVAAMRGGTKESGDAAARAIMTTDTRDKQVVVKGDGYTIGGLAKGAAMLAPNMATMIAVLTTDAAVEPGELRRWLGAAADKSFNALDVDGCTSTNDTVLILASGKAGAPKDLAKFGQHLAEACVSLAMQMANDAESATKVVRMTVCGAGSDAEARVAARQVAQSQLVKCSWFGCDPYWGRIAAELGVAGVAFDAHRLRVSYGGVEVCRGGVKIEHDVEAVKGHMAGRELEIVADLGIGAGRFTIITNDLTHGYIDENKDTS